MMPVISFGGMTVLEGFDFRWGFIAGDCLTVRAGFLVEAEEVFLFDLRKVAGVEAEACAE